MAVNDPVSFNEIIAALKTKLDLIPDFGLVDTCVGGPSPWSQGRKEPHWVLDVGACRQAYHTIPGSALQMEIQYEPVVMLDGWLPWSETTFSEEIWRFRVSDALDCIEENRSLGLGFPVVGNPSVAVDDYQMKTSLNKGDLPTECHYVKIIIPVTGFYTMRATG